MVYAMLLRSRVHLFRDEKPLIFQTGISYPVSLPMPVFYHSREIKELGTETVKINNSRIIGMLLTKANATMDNEHDKQRIYEAIDLLMDRTKPSKVGVVKTEN